MRSKPALLMVVALGCGTVAAFAATQVIKDQGQTQAVAMVEIVVAAKDAAANTKISTDKFVLEKWPQDRLPQGAIRDFKAVEGSFTNQRLYQGEPLLERKVNKTNNGIEVPKGMKIFDLPVDANNGGVGYIQPGHRVDIHGFFEKNGKLKESKSVLVMENVEVLMVDGVAVREQEEGHNRKAATIQLLIRSSQYEALNTAKNLGKLTVSLRPTVEGSSNDEATDNGEAFLEWAKSAVNEEEGANTKVSEPVAAPTPTKRLPKKKMVIITPSGAESYAWDNDNEFPEKVEAATESTASSTGYSSYPVSASPSESSNSQSLTNGMIWDGKQWTYNPSGFKPIYPGADDDKTKKPGSTENSASNGPTEGPAS
jgi:pilus assembly protein CpaB